jgi:arginine decarboxylase
MNIYITSGEGHGSTLLSSFDAALKDANVYNYNLITLSSIIPPKSVVIEEKLETKDQEYGHKLYVVKAEARSREAGRFIGAAIGWYFFGEDGRGMFVEHNKIGESKESVEEALNNEVTKSLTDMCKFRNLDFDQNKVNIKSKVVKVTSSASCAMVIAAYKSESWE